MEQGLVRMAAKKMDETVVRQIEVSGLFDEDWYLATYRDVAALSIPPLEHYLRFGWIMGRSPSQRFDAAAYLDDHPDVEEACTNPLLHYIRNGRCEGRRVRAVGQERPSPAVLQPESIQGTNAVPVVSSSSVEAGAARGIAPAARKLPLTALVITWDVGHNPLGRSYMLAEVLDRVVRNVVIVGFQFPRYGDKVWEPVREGRLPVIALPGQNFPEFAESLEELAQRIKPDVVIACKSRLPSVQLGVLIKERFDCPLILDIDDHELTFFNGAEEVSLEQLAAMPDGAATDMQEPYTALWTGLAQHMRKYADEVLVSNVELHRAFGGTIVPHVRDEHRFDPALYDRDTAREMYGVPRDVRVLLFFGTPRVHKGINVLAEAIGKDINRDAVLVVVGTATDRRVVATLDKLAAGRVIYLPNQPFTSIPGIVAMADVVCLPQDEGSEISRYQLPAKAIDAIGMGIPLLATRTQPMGQLIDDGVAIAVERGDVAMQVKSIAGDRQFQRDWAARVRGVFLERYSYAAAARQMRTIITRAVGSRRKPLDDLRILLEHQRRVLGMAPHPAAMPRGEGIDIVVFWKQNDTGLYGRRSDMTIRYLAQRADVRRVLVLDAPISEHDLLVRRNNASKHSHDRLIYQATYEKLLGRMDVGKVKHDVFVFPPGRYATHASHGNRPSLASAYCEYLEGAMRRVGIIPSEAVFWIYPKNYLGAEIVDHFQPRTVVVDVVDDHRAWPGISDAERERLTANYRELLLRAHMSFANCETVVESMREFSPAIRLVPNGCDEDMVVAVPVSGAFEEYAASTKQVIGFVGNLEKKIDIELIGKLADRYPEALVVLLGSTHANPEVLELQRHPNIMLPGVVPYGQVGAWVSRFDVGIVPHLDMDLTRSMNPLKLYVYLSCRVPVVSTEIYNIDRSSPLLRVATSHDDFIAQVGELLATGKPEPAVFDSYVRANSWTARFRWHIDELLESVDGAGVTGEEAVCADGPKISDGLPSQGVVPAA